VLSKLFTALVVSGAIVVVVAVAAVLAVLLLASVGMLIGGGHPAAVWSGSQLLQTTVAITYWQISIALWYAPVAAWLLLVSSWATRGTFLWAVGTPIALAVFERVAIRTSYLQNLLNTRLADPVLARFATTARGAELTIRSEEGIKAHGIPGNVLDGIDPVAFFTNPW